MDIQILTCLIIKLVQIILNVILIYCLIVRDKVFSFREVDTFFTAYINQKDVRNILLLERHLFNFYFKLRPLI